MNSKVNMFIKQYTVNTDSSIWDAGSGLLPVSPPIKID